MKDTSPNKQEGIIELIVLILIALVLMRYLGITVSGVINWFLAFFRSVLR